MESAIDSSNSTSPAPNSPDARMRDVPLTPLSLQHPHVDRTERGLVVKGTRLTLYDIQERLEHGMQPSEIAALYELSSEQVADALRFISENDVTFATEYRYVIRRAVEQRSAWQEANRVRLANIFQMPPPSGKEEAFARLRARQAEIRRE